MSDLIQAQMLAGLWRQALLLTAMAALLLALRPMLLRRVGPQATYASWLLLPAVLLTPWLPAGVPPAVQLSVFWNEVAPPPLPGPQHAASGISPLLAAWLVGTALVLTWQAARQWRLMRAGPVLVSGASPALVGLLKPQVALPADFRQRFSDAEQRLILAHEAVHRARRDNAWNLLTCLLTALHWWNPLAWIAARRMQADQELACDAAVLAAHPDGRADYTRALMAAHGLTPPRAPLASRWGSRHPLVERMAMLNRPARLSPRRRAGLGFALLTAFGLAWAAQQLPPAVMADAQAKQKVEIRMNVTSGDVQGLPRLITTLGVPISIAWSDPQGQGWRLEQTVEVTDGDRLRVTTRASYAGRAVSSFTGHQRSGKAENMRFITPGAADLALTRTVTLLPPGFQMPTSAAPRPTRP